MGQVPGEKEQKYDKGYQHRGKDNNSKDTDPSACGAGTGFTVGSISGSAKGKPTRKPPKRDKVGTGTTRQFTPNSTNTHILPTNDVTAQRKKGEAELRQKNRAIEITSPMVRLGNNSPITPEMSLAGQASAEAARQATEVVKKLDFSNRKPITARTQSADSHVLTQAHADQTPEQEGDGGLIEQTATGTDRKRTKNNEQLERDRSAARSPVKIVQTREGEGSKRKTTPQTPSTQ